MENQYWKKSYGDNTGYWEKRVYDKNGKTVYYKNSKGTDINIDGEESQKKKNIKKTIQVNNINETLLDKNNLILDNIKKKDVENEKFFDLIESILFLKKDILEKKEEYKNILRNDEKISKENIEKFLKNQNKEAGKELKEKFTFVKENLQTAEKKDKDFINTTLDALEALDFNDTPILKNKTADKIFKKRVKEMIQTDDLDLFQKTKNQIKNLEYDVVFKLLKEKADEVKKYIKNAINGLNDMKILINRFETISVDTKENKNNNVKNINTENIKNSENVENSNIENINIKESNNPKPSEEKEVKKINFDFKSSPKENYIKPKTIK